MARPVHSETPLPQAPASVAAPGCLAHHCGACGAAYECEGPGELGSCAPVCPPCYWIELGSQLRIYQEMVRELERRRSDIEHRVGKGACLSAAARRRKLRNDHASLLVAFGNVMSTQPSAQMARLNLEAQGGSHE